MGNPGMGNMFDDVNTLSATQVISSVTGNKKCVSNIADANVLQYLLLVLYMLPSCELAHRAFNQEHIRMGGWSKSM